MDNIPLLYSIKTRIFFAVTLVVAAVAGVVMSSSQSALERESIAAEERSAGNVLKLVEDNIRGRYRSLLKDKVATVEARKQQFREFQSVLRSTLGHFAGLAERGAIKEETAREMALRWLATTQPVEGDFLLVFDEQGRVLVSPDPDQRDLPLQAVFDLKGRPLAQAARDESARFGESFLSFTWVDSGGVAEPKFGHFVAYPRWGWVLGLVGDVGRVEREVERQLDQLRTELAETLPQIRSSGRGGVFIFDGGGRMVVAPGDDGHAAAVTDGARRGLMTLAHTPGEQTLTLAGAGGEELEGRATYIKPFDWYIASLASRDAMREPARRLVAGQAGIFLAALVAGLLIALFLAHRITLPLNRLSDYARRLPETDFTSGARVADAAALPTARRDEIGRLAKAFAFMEDSLHANVNKLMQAVSARERIEGELNIARDIQMDLLPKMFPPFPDRPEVDLYSSLVSAKEVGGDLYDFYFLSKNHLCFTIGDVSGKGVPAALFMAITRTLIRAASERESDPARMLDKVNDDLSRDNPNCIFVTLVVGVMDVRNGRTLYANAGHNPPLVLRRASGVEWLPGRSGPAAGVVEGASFELLETTLEPGDCLLLYTDGVTEAMDTAGSLYGNERLFRLMEGATGESARAVVARITEDVHLHAGAAEQSDDITVLAVGYRGAQQNTEEA
ncbi:SpoIIE family protein phosphatase [Pseudothauera rhizosphaerae]|uniref:HAMP domain-containing protein n=1 Tax=Pseudothauera rhizosphaerae TaxID=2565932 RepID=A0A4V3W9Z8_9RHOO|nr:SpoIIE family protein phosphatase [Pseudothauera rhizosphaerae]THF57249.1 HAMP domain-containing protein [Pseudothauera rhizosphaerae]